MPTLTSWSCTAPEDTGRAGDAGRRRSYWASCFVKRRQEPFPPDRGPMLRSSVTARMIAIPRPPSSSSSPPGGGLERLEAAALVRDLDRDALVEELVADLDRAFAAVG